MKRTLKGIICLLVLALTLGAAAMFTACGGDKTIDKVTDLQFNFETGDFSFSGVEGAKEYRVRIFPFVDDGNGNMVESELPINESNAMRGGKDSYTGNVPMWSLTPGAEYNVYVLATSEDENVGDSTSDPVKGTYIAVYDAVEAVYFRWHQPPREGAPRPGGGRFPDPGRPTRKSPPRCGRGRPASGLRKVCRPVRDW